ncbi:polysaccharide biosynthesis protein [Glycocaulis sp.]
MLYRNLEPLFSLPLPVKQAVKLAVDAAAIVLAYMAALFLRVESFAFLPLPGIWIALAITLPLSLVAFSRLGLYRAVIRFSGLEMLRILSLGAALSAALLLGLTLAFSLGLPRSVPFIYAFLLIGVMSGPRLLLRTLFLQRQALQKSRVIIYGAGAGGRQVVMSLHQAADYLPVAFVDDDPALHGRHINGLDVHPPASLPDLVRNTRAKMVLLAIPSASLTQRKRILSSLEPLKVRVKTIPGMMDIVSGRASVSEIQQVAPDDLLERDPVPADPQLLSANITGCTVMVTGAGGSIGSELCRQILRQRPHRLLLVEQSEFALYAIERELQTLEAKLGGEVAIIPLLTSVQHESRMNTILSRLEVDTVFHAAAYKHVPLVEQNVVEGLRNNTFGTLTMARAAIRSGVKTFTLVSTDKAVRPPNIMGASKRLAELVCQSLACTQNTTTFSMVRFGNVLESSGSVVPLFRRQIAAGGPVTVTDREVTRYFMTITEASELVLQASALAKGGEVFVLDMGEPVRVLDLAKRIIRLSGLKPFIAGEEHPEGGDIEIVFTGLRHGEKQFEELLVSADARPTGHPRILSEPVMSVPWDELEPAMERLLEACAAYEITRIARILAELPTGYTAQAEPADLIWQLSRELESPATGTG